MNLLWKLHFTRIILYDFTGNTYHTSALPFMEFSTLNYQWSNNDKIWRETFSQVLFSGAKTQCVQISISVLIHERAMHVSLEE